MKPKKQAKKNPKTPIKTRRQARAAHTSGAGRVISPFATASGGGGYAGASTMRGLSGWNASSYDADSDLLPVLDVLRNRAQEQYRNNPAAHGVINRIVTGTVGAGLSVRSIIDRTILGLDETAAREWEDAAEREFRLWADSRECDFSRRMTFNEIQMLAMKSQKVRGDCFVLMSWRPREGVPYDLRLQLIEGDRISNPQSRADDDEIAGGIERDANGIPVAIHIQATHPGNVFTTRSMDWKKVPIFGTKSHRRQVLHLMNFERVDQSRGEPCLAPAMATLKQLNRYAEAELAAAIANAVLSVFVKRPLEGENLQTGLEARYSDEDRAAWENRSLTLGPGTWIDGAPGEELQTVSASRPSAQFDPFFAACVKQVGMAEGVPYEVLAQFFQSSYSASRAAILEAGKTFKVNRSWLRNNLCQPIYEEFLTEAVVKGRLTAPGFLTDPIIRAAYCQSEWMGPSPGQIDPVKEVTAAWLRWWYGFSTMGKETAELSEADFEQVSYSRAKEFNLLKQLGIGFEPLLKQAMEMSSKEDDENA